MTDSMSAIGRPSEDASRLAWVRRRLQLILDADRRRHVTDARFCSLLDDEPGRRVAGPPMTGTDADDARLASLL